MDGEPEPGYNIADASVDELAAASSLGSPVATTELTRRRAASTA